MSDQGSYTFLPWLRRGAAASITRDDVVDDGQSMGRAAIPAELVLGYVPVQGGPQPDPATPPVLARTVELVGPGDIRTLKDDAILRVYPVPDSPNAAPGELAFVEFYDEDLPWRYTPARPVHVSVAGQDRPRLRPWLALFVLLDDEFDLRLRTAETPVLTVHPGVELPPLDEGWAWAHVQIAGEATQQNAGEVVMANPDAALSRLLSPRRLVPNATYTAFVVPAFDTGRRAGLAESTAGVPALRPAWGTDQREFPIYHSWRFTTGADGSFESLARRLTARPVDDAFGKREVRVVAPAYGLTEGDLPASFQLEGALRPPTFPRQPYPQGSPGLASATAMQGAVDLAVGWLVAGTDVPVDPGVVPPAYGRWHAGVGRLAEVADPNWVREVNLDLRQRAVAGLGAEVVRTRQDDLMERAWNQVGRLRDANQRLREGELSVATAEAMFGKHLAGLPGERAMVLTGAAHRGLPAPAETVVTPAEAVAAPSVRAMVRASALPTATGEAGFKRATRPGRLLLRQATGGRDLRGFQNGHLLERLNNGTVSAAPAVPTPAGAISLQAIQAVVSAAGTAITPKLLEPKRVFWRLLVDMLAATVPATGPIVLPSAQSLRTGPALATAWSQWVSAHPQEADAIARVPALIAAITDVRTDGPDSALVEIRADIFATEFGGGIAGKGGDGVTIMCRGGSGTIARMADADGAQQYAVALAEVDTDLSVRLGLAPVPAAPIGSLPTLAEAVVDGLRPERALVARIAAALPGFTLPPAPADPQAQREQRRLRPVLAYPVFDEPMVEALTALDRNYILPNIGALPADTMTLMEPNGRFIEAYMAGLNTEMARELLWREYPTDQRGSYFRVFWSRADALTNEVTYDAKPLREWVDALGENGIPGSSPFVLVLRSELLRRFPNTFIYAQAARRTAGGREFDPQATPVFPVFQANLDPDVSLVGFDLPGDPRGRPATVGDQGDPGMFFVLKERPGQVRFGLDLTAPAGGFATWDDLWWGQLQGAEHYIRLGTNQPSPTTASPGTWGATAADMAVILLRGQVMYARHAADMLPTGSTL